MIFSIDGNIGSGKSTIVRALKKSLAGNKNIIFLELIPYRNGRKLNQKMVKLVLEKIYSDQTKYAFSFK